MECIRKRRDRYADRYAYVVYANLLRVLTNIAIFVTSKGHARDSRQVPMVVSVPHQYRRLRINCEVRVPGCQG